MPTSLSKNNIFLSYSMGDYSSLKTFDEFITLEMAPSATFIVWHVDESSGAIVFATLTVHISSKQFTRVCNYLKSCMNLIKIYYVSMSQLDFLA